MKKSIVIAAAASAFLFTAAPAFAQDAACAAPGHRDGFDGPHGSASNLRDAPSADPTAARRPGFNGPHGSASDLRDAPRPEGRHIPRATLYGRKAGDDKRQDAQPAPRPSSGLTKVGTGTLTLAGSSTANTCR